MEADICYDLLMEDDMDFIEGTFRLPGSDWKVFIVMKRQVSRPDIAETEWANGASGLIITVPVSLQLNKQILEYEMGKHLGVARWHETRGSDSMSLR